MKENCNKEMTASNIREMRLKTGLTQEEFCENFGLNLNTYRHWERGDRKPTGSSLVLLNMIESSGSQVLKILSGDKIIEGDMLTGKKILQDSIENQQGFSFKDLLEFKEKLVSDVFLALIKANGFPYVSVVNKHVRLDFFAGNEPNALRQVLWFDVKSHEVGGEFNVLIEKTFLVIVAIEKDLSDASYWTQHMRKERINEIMSQINVDSEFFSNVLRNW